MTTATQTTPTHGIPISFRIKDFGRRVHVLGKVHGSSMSEWRKLRTFKTVADAHKYLGTAVNYKKQRSVKQLRIEAAK